MENRTMNNNFTVDFIILGCLSMQPMSGYDIKRLISISTSLFYNASYGSIYPTLKKNGGSRTGRGGRGCRKWSL